jgi:hypothetical protein
MEFTAAEESGIERGEADPLDIASWYPTFSKHSIKTKIIKLPDRFASYLVEDGIVLPEHIGKHALGNDMLSDDEDDPASASAADGAAEAPRLPDAFHDVDACLQSTMNDFGGKIMVKINDKAPTDSLWINCGTLMCNSVSSVYMVLKASEKVALALKESGDNYLVVRKWANMFPSMEFRCFISDGDLICICQKDASTHYPFLAADSTRIHTVISRFFESHVQEKLPVQSVVLDVYVDKQDRVWLIGFSPFGEETETDSLLFSWGEIKEHILCRGDASVEEIVAFEPFRVIEGESKVLPRNPSVGASRGPSDLNLISGNLFSRNSKLLQRNGDDSDSSDD